MIIKANKELVIKIASIANKVKNLGIIIQNDVDISTDQWLNFIDEYEQCINLMDDWMLDVRKHKKDCNRTS
jgi:hypothetical protein